MVIDIFNFNIFIKKAFIKQRIVIIAMRRLIHHNITTSPFILLNRYPFYKPKPDQPSPPSQLKHSMFNKKTFPEIINIIKNPSNPYPKNSAYFYTVL